MSARDCPRCNTEFVLIVPGLELCDCSARGRLSSLKGAEAEARRLLPEGGLPALRDRLARERQARLEKRKRPTGGGSTKSFPR